MVKVNDTLRFVLPMFYNKEIGINADFFMNKFFKGAYTSDFNNPQYDDKLILVYLYSVDNEFTEFEEKLKSCFNLESYIDLNDDLVYYVMDIPEEYKDDYTLILTKLFDKLSPILKLKIMKMWELSDDDGLFRIITGQESYIGANIEDEIVNFNTEVYVESI